MSRHEHIADYTVTFRGHTVSIHTDALGPWTWAIGNELPTWETMVFAYTGPERLNSVCWRYLSREHALSGHFKMVNAIESYLQSLERAVSVVEQAAERPLLRQSDRRAFREAAALLAQYGLPENIPYGGDTLEESAG